jgi:hypothetical protein
MRKGGPGAAGGTPPAPSALPREGDRPMRRVILGSMIMGLLVVGFTISQFMDRLP